MTLSNTPKLNLDTLRTGIPALSPHKAGQRMEACVWCLLECQHDNGVFMTVLEKDESNIPHNNSQYEVCWTEEEIDVQALFRAYNKDDGPEHGAEAIALLFIRERTDYTAIRRSVTSTGIDYWLGYKTIQNNQLFPPSSARLEVFGILRQTPTNKPKYRTNNKVEQTKRSDSTSFPAYVIVVEFSQPMTTVVLRHVTKH